MAGRNVGGREDNCVDGTSKTAGDEVKDETVGRLGGGVEA